MKKQFIIAGLLACISASNKLHAQYKNSEIEQLEEIVVTATKFKTNKKNVGKVVYTINQETLQKSQGRTLVDLLNDVPGIEINGNFSTRGQNLGYYIRGGRNRQVAILINGVNVNDPSSFNGDFDLRQIDMNQIERIEILKGAASTLYGSGAATGVINIILKKASKEHFNGTFSTSLGTNTSSEERGFSGEETMLNFSFSGTLDDVDYMVALNTNRSTGLSAAENTDQNNPFEEDVFSRQNALLQLNYKVSSKLKLGILTSIDDFSTDFDGFDFDPVSFASVAADRDNNLNSLQKRLAFTADYDYDKGKLKVRSFVTDIERNETPSEDFFTGEVYGFDVFTNYNFNERFSLLVGLTAQYQDMTQRTSFTNIDEGNGKQHFYDPYLSFNYLSDVGFNLNIGTRINIHSEYGSNMVYNINPSYNFEVNENPIKLFTSLGTAFIAPTLSEIFTKLPTVEELLPEETTSYEVGFETILFEKLNINSTYFYREETNKIGYDPTTFQTINDVGTFFARGLEAELSYQFSEKWNVLANYTFIDRAENLLLKIPQNIFFLRANYTLSDQTNFSISYRNVDETYDFGNVALEAYELVDIFVNHKILKDKITIFASVTNLFNEDYQEIAGFTTRGRNLSFGLRTTF